MLTAEQLSEIARELGAASGVCVGEERANTRFAPTEKKEDGAMNCAPTREEKTDCATTERRRVIEKWMAFYQCSAQQVYRWAKQGGWQSKRKERADRGARRSPVPAAEIERAAIVKYLSTTAKYANWMPAEVAADVTGAASAGVRPHHVNALLRQMQLDRDAQSVDCPRVTRATRRPNDEHQFDTSACAMWHLDDRERLCMNKQAGRDKNKAPKRQVIRYVMTDHFTHCIFVQYQVAYESFASSAKFLHQAWSRKSAPEMFPFCGAPQRLYIDQGPTFHSGHFKELCRNLGIDLQGKQPSGVRSKSGKEGSASALGSVESAHPIIEKHFETRLKLQRPETLEELNDWAYRWCILYNGTRKHSRYGMQRFALWSTIRNEELLVPPADLEVFMSLGERAQMCHVYSDMTIRFRGPHYSLENVPMNLRETDVEVHYSPYTYPNLRVKGKDGNYYEAKPLAKMGALEGGYYSNAVFTGDYKSFADTETERSQKFAEGYDVGEIRAFRNFDEDLRNVRFMPKRGKEILTTDSHGFTRISLLEAKAKIVDALGRGLTIEEGDELRARYGEWMDASEIIAEIQRLKEEKETGSRIARMGE